MASSTPQKRRMAPRPATDPNRWRQVTGGRNIRRQPQKSTLQKALRMLPLRKQAGAAQSSRKGSAGKAAMLMSAAGLAYKNRDKLSGMLNKRRADTSV